MNQADVLKKLSALLDEIEPDPVLKRKARLAKRKDLLERIEYLERTHADLRQKVDEIKSKL